MYIYEIIQYSVEQMLVYTCKKHIHWHNCHNFIWVNQRTITYLKHDSKTLNMMIFIWPIDSPNTTTCVIWKKEMNEIDFVGKDKWCLTYLPKDTTKIVHVLPLGCCVPTFYLQLPYILPKTSSNTELLK